MAESDGYRRKSIDEEGRVAAYFPDDFKQYLDTQLNRCPVDTFNGWVYWSREDDQSEHPPNILDLKKKIRDVNFMRYLSEDAFSFTNPSFSNCGSISYPPFKVDIALECMRLQVRLSMPPPEVHDFPQGGFVDLRIQQSNSIRSHNPNDHEEHDILQEILSVAQASQELINQDMTWGVTSGGGSCYAQQAGDDFSFHPHAVQIHDMMNNGGGGGSSRLIMEDQQHTISRSIEIGGFGEDFKTERMVENLRWVGMSSKDLEKEGGLESSISDAYHHREGGPLQSGREMIQLDLSNQQSMDALNNESNVVSAERSNIDVICSQEKGKTKRPKRVHNKIGVKIEIPLDDILQNSKKSIQVAADNLKVSRSTLKRVCRGYGFSRWPPRKNIVIRDANIVTVKAKYINDIIIRFPLSLSSGLVELQQQMANRLPLEDGTYYVKYKDEVDDLIVIACDQDLQDYISSSTSLGSTTIMVFIVPK